MAVPFGNEHPTDRPIARWGINIIIVNNGVWYQALFAGRRGT